MANKQTHFNSKSNYFYIWKYLYTLSAVRETDVYLSINLAYLLLLVILYIYIYIYIYKNNTFIYSIIEQRHYYSMFAMAAIFITKFTLVIVFVNTGTCKHLYPPLPRPTVFQAYCVVFHWTYSLGQFHNM